jgi:hypothetical protein
MVKYRMGVNIDAPERPNITAKVLVENRNDSHKCNFIIIYIAAWYNMANYME